MTKQFESDTEGRQAGAILKPREVTTAIWGSFDEHFGDRDLVRANGGGPYESEMILIIDGALKRLFPQESAQDGGRTSKRL